MGTRERPRNRLHSLREAAAVPPEDLAREFGLTRSSLLRMENGEDHITPELAERFAGRFGVSLDYLLGWRNSDD